MRIRPRKYKWKNLKHDCCSYGMIGQEVAENVKTMPPKSIVNHYDEYLADNECKEILGLSYRSFIPLLIKKVQEQHKEINELKEEKQIISNKLEEIKEIITNSSAKVPISDSKSNPNFITLFLFGGFPTVLLCSFLFSVFFWF